LSHLGPAHSPRHDQVSKEGSIIDDDTETKEEPKSAAHDELQTFVFSATLSKELQVNLKKKRKGGTKHYKREERPSSTLGVSGLRLPRLLIF
jgi:ATP-dependent RNA helicase DDX24/MAK5